MKGDKSRNNLQINSRNMQVMQNKIYSLIHVETDMPEGMSHKNMGYISHVCLGNFGKWLDDPFSSHIQICPLDFFAASGVSW